MRYLTSPDYDDIFTMEDAMKKISNVPYSFYRFPPKWRDNEIVAMKAISLHSYNFRYISDRLKNKRFIIFKTLIQNPFLFYLFPEIFRDDKEICLIAVEQNGFNVRFLSERLLNDPDIFEILIYKNSWYINYTSIELRSDPNFMLHIIEKNPFLFQSIHTPLKTNKNFVLFIIKTFKIPLNYIGKNLLEDVDVLELAIKIDQFNYFFLKDSIQSNRTLINKFFYVNKNISKFFYSDIHSQILDRYHFFLFLNKIRKEKNEEIFQNNDIPYLILDFLW